MSPQLSVCRQFLFVALLAIGSGSASCKYSPQPDGQLACVPGEACPEPLRCRERISGGSVCCRDNCPPDIVGGGGSTPNAKDGSPNGDGALPPDGPTGGDAGNAPPSTEPEDLACMARPCSGQSPDACCPPACNAGTDVDCAGCGNGTVEQEKGETCDPPESCPTSCPPVTCKSLALQGSAAACNASCVATAITQCMTGDACCPAGCNAGNDSECSAVCGNNTKEPGETCEPVTECARQEGGCQSTEDIIKEKTGQADQCTFACVERPRPCVAGDGQCPSACNAAMDTDCPGCGNSRLEPPETCDPAADCMQKATACAGDQNMIRTKVGNPLICNFSCQEMQRPCADDGRWCPTRCNASNDRDCPGCGNEKVEAGERCDPPAACRVQRDNCVSDADAIRTRSGDPAACTFQCATMKRMCGQADGYCPSGCTVAIDADCAGCGNGRIEGGETCDPPMTCQTRHNACVSDAMTVRTRTGDPRTCSFVCVESPRECASGDGFCRPGCDYENDKECTKPAGDMCTWNPECTSGQCVDNRCCTVSSCALCSACTGMGGACEPVKHGSTDTGCSFTSACDGSGACKLVDGQACTTHVECLNGNCAPNRPFPSVGRSCTTVIFRPDPPRPLPPIPPVLPPVVGP